MNIVRVTASSDVLRGLHDIDGFQMAGSVKEAGGGAWTTSAYATDEAIAVVRDRGAHVDVLLDAQTRLAQLHREAAEARAIESEGTTPETGA